MDKFVKQWRKATETATDPHTSSEVIAETNNPPSKISPSASIDSVAMIQNNDVLEMHSNEKTSRTEVSASSSSGRKFLSRWTTTFPWLQYSERLEKAFCSICSKCYKDLKVKLPTAGVTDQNAYTAFVTEGFSNWKKATERFKSHEQSSVHRHACSSVEFHQTKNVSVMMSKQMTQARIDARFCLDKIFDTIKFLAMQGLPLRGHSEIYSNFIQLLHLRATDCPKLKFWLDSSKKYKWTSHDIINEMLALMSQHVQRQILSEISKQPFYAIMSDETTDISRKEQMSVNFRHVDESLRIHETFLGFYDTPSTDSETLFTVMKDVLLRFELPVNKCRGQCYDGASSVSCQWINNRITDSFQGARTKSMVYTLCWPQFQSGVTGCNEPNPRNSRLSISYERISNVH
ncbi:zinc finger MYM-type protein 1-like [Bradysia coprophila]|uniref:zinc finger MYM-type protein 1-like n=1 Tax=Bradysia coprophila TaxID=38358 RepID=UPI00187DB601|nr:zinc finger MYM-type protein 1-like [Bradysia coprophila]